MAAASMVREGPTLPANLEARILAGGRKWTQIEANAYLDACPKVLMVVPLDPWEAGLRGRRLKYVNWNGHPFLVEKGKQVRVPEPIAEILGTMMEPERTDQMRDREPFRMIVSPESPGGMDMTLGLGYPAPTARGG